MTSLITIGLGFIFLLRLLILLNKYRKGVPLSRFDKIVGIFEIIGVIIVILDHTPQVPDMLKIQFILPSEVIGVIYTCIVFAIIFLMRRYITPIRRFLRIPKIEPTKQLNQDDTKHPSEPPHSATRIEVRGKTFLNQDVYIDGHTWKQCKFKNCNIIIERGDFDLISNSFDGCRLTSKGGAVGILKIAKLFYPQIPLNEPSIDDNVDTPK